MTFSAEHKMAAVCTPELYVEKKTSWRYSQYFNRCFRDEEKLKQSLQCKKGVKWHKRHPKFSRTIVTGLGSGYPLWLKIFRGAVLATWSNTRTLLKWHKLVCRVLMIAEPYLLQVLKMKFLVREICICLCIGCPTQKVKVCKTNSSQCFWVDPP